ncbi:Glutamyl-tRNA amidotransferase B subunit [Gymnopus androsaceus JB14]|uniref:Glutamyl-tRNA(Gln) amidotransferase subunit B, mitochondrial n=1 Tax=Gymnopus androsaceus JB14 TaxID=1447944 RepID=A0A6A4IU42_9AGAR|nr:Glutamyl-tRNA amidotransferase B subunit [Gymnopus androsaceus JB14]
MSRLLVDGWQVIIGIETHVQIKSRQKLFSKAPTSLLNHLPNTRYNAFDASFPGTLPRLNRKCLDLALRAALALNCSVKTRSSFDRKHYFYSDQPAGYQITQHYSPFAVNGQFTFPKLETPIRIKQIQLEQDTAKSITNPRTRTALIDLNRAGTGLLEIKQAAEYVRSLQELLRAVGVSDGNMEAGSLRCDVNVSINRPGEPPGTRCEVKNINSIKFMVAAIGHFVLLLTILQTSEKVPQETRGFDHDNWKTFKMRSKEDAPEYRYMPDPNLGALVLSRNTLTKYVQEMPSLPAATRLRLLETYSSSGVTENNIDVLMNLDATRDIPYDGATDESTIGAVTYFEMLCSEGRDPKFVMNWIIQNLLGQLSALERPFNSEHIPVARMSELLNLITTKQMTRPSAKLLLRHMLVSPTNVPIAAIRGGNENVINKVIGWIMRETRGKADAKQAKDMVEQLLHR